VNVDFRGRTKQILESMVEEGYANTQSEAARLAIIQFGEEHFSEMELVNKKLDNIDQDIKAGKRKLLNSDEALGNYAKYLK
jgi:membrane-bound ClpP family serine protease